MHDVLRHWRSSNGAALAERFAAVRDEVAVDLDKLAAAHGSPADVVTGLVAALRKLAVQLPSLPRARG